MIRSMDYQAFTSTHRQQYSYFVTQKGRITNYIKKTCNEIKKKITKFKVDGAHIKDLSFKTKIIYCVQYCKQYIIVGSLKRFIIQFAKFLSYEDLIDTHLVKCKLAHISLFIRLCDF